MLRTYRQRLFPKYIYIYTVYYIYIKNICRDVLLPEVKLSARYSILRNSVNQKISV